MKIAMLIGGLGRGGTEAQLIRLAKGLHAKKIKVEVWCYAGVSSLDKELTELGIRVRTGQGGNQRQKIRLIRQWMSEFQPDILHGFMKRASSLAVLASFGRGYGGRDKGEGIKDIGYGIGEKKRRESEHRTLNVERRTSNEVLVPCSSSSPGPISSDEGAYIPYPAAKPRISGAKRPAIIGSDLSTATYAPWRLSLWPALVLFGFANVVVTQTELNKRSLIRLAPWLRGKVRVIRNGLDLSRFKPRKMDNGEGIMDNGEGIMDKGGEKGEGEHRTERGLLSDVGLPKSDSSLYESNDELQRSNVGEEIESRTSNVEHRELNENPQAPGKAISNPECGTYIPYPATKERISSDEGAHIPSAADLPTFRFAVVGSVYGVKNPVRVVEAVQLLRKQGVENFKVEWYGRLGLGKEAESGSADYHQAMGLIREYGLGDVISFKGESGEIEKVLPGCDALIHPSLQEGFPNAVVEAMACGLPIVVGQVSDLPLVVETANNGFVFDETDPAAIAEGMRKMMVLGEEERVEMCEQSRKLAEGWFGVERFVGEYVELYAELVKVQ